MAVRCIARRHHRFIVPIDTTVELKGVWGCFRCRLVVISWLLNEQVALKLCDRQLYLYGRRVCLITATAEFLTRQLQVSLGGELGLLSRRLHVGFNHRHLVNLSLASLRLRIVVGSATIPVLREGILHWKSGANFFLDKLFL